MRFHSLLVTLVAAAAIVLPACGEAEPVDEPCVSPNGACIELTAEGDVQLKIQEALFDAVPGDVIYLKEGVYDLTSTLSLEGTENVTIRGQGKDRTILSFKGQADGSAGIHVRANGISFENFAVEDTQEGNDGIVVRGSTGVTFRGMRVEWTGGPDKGNGSYGLYPVQCTDVVIENSVVKAASDAGIYVGQSQNVIVRNNRAEYNVAGIEIENTIGADVYGNVAVNNTGGILIFSLPGLQIPTGYRTRVFDNDVSNNNTENFAPSGIVGVVPAGTGIMILSVAEIEVFGNEVHGNNTANLAIASLLLEDEDIANTDPDLDPYPEAIFIHGNHFSDGGQDPDRNALVAVLLGRIYPERVLPDIVWDGNRRPEHRENGFPDNRRICIQDNGGATFVDLNMEALNAAGEISYDLAPHDCSLPPVAPITIAGVD